MPAAVAVTAVFANLAATAARAHGYPAMRTFVLPHPMESRPEAEVRRMAAERFDELVRLVADAG